MSYKINKTDGSLIAEVIDSAIDQTATDVTLIGKNVTGYGEYINENFIKLLENFAATSEPANPIAGQLWYDTGENRLKVYDGNGFRVSGGPIASATTPLNTVQGDLWIDTRERVLYFNDGNGFILASKIWGSSQGKSGLEVLSILDNFGNTKVIVELRCGNVLLGIFSKDPEFTPAASINGYPAGTSIKPGFNGGSLDGMKFYVRASTSDALVDNLGNIKTAADFLTKSGTNLVTGTLSISNEEPLILGLNQQTSLSVTNLAFTIASEWIDQDFRVHVKNISGTKSAIVVDAAAERVAIFKDSPQATLDVAGDVIIDGNLTVKGDTTSIEVTEVKVEDKNIELAVQTSPTDAYANGGGIILKGSDDHTILWNFDNITPDNNRWVSSENFDLASSKTYKIAGIDVLSSTTLGSSVVTSNLTSVGTLTSLNVSNGSIGLNIDGTSISAVSGILSNVNIILNPKGTNGYVSVSGKQIKDVGTPGDAGDAVSLGYLGTILPLNWQEIDSDYQSVANERLFISTLSGPITVTLPSFPNEGDTVRFFDYDSSFDINPLSIIRHRTVDEDTLSGTSATSSIGTYASLNTITTGVGTGLKVNVQLTVNNATYNKFNTIIEVTSQGVNYKNGDTIRVPGTSLGGTSPANDLIFQIILENILAEDQDLEIGTKNTAFGLIYTNANQGWRLAEQTELPPEINVDIVGDVTGNVTGDVLGNVTGNVTGDITGTVLTAAQPNITQVGTLTALTVSGTISGNLNGNVSGNVTGNVLGNVTGNVNGDILTSDISSTGAIEIQSGAGPVRVISGNSGIRLSTFDNTGSQEQYLEQHIPGTAPGNRTTTLLFGDVVVSNTNSSNVSGSSFRLPVYTTTQRDARVYTFLNHGELIYNSDVHKVQVYANGVWVDLH
jgi:hypothetical protein